MLDEFWYITPCPCIHEFCYASRIEPGIVTGVGTIRTEVAEHIVELHNQWLKDREAVNA